ncbi:uncharacterized protein B0I36DRAFT_144101 [Microdochium trichocladiopsis]|uniref:Uncharacterized protein n=1 Tax=Microdochium trichocladiopsis TaxID=1682393 RepID=A0A9P8Y4K8_9PEZI|nr:uncharacterized protein B0I36DRAFT_144101 [Microdochium trichocladiopsis]KAH7027837.1 hypothetical protein B0I36DRAFT_144101 [Microdochium trichocladiopsis]
MGTSSPQISLPPHLLTSPCSRPQSSQARPLRGRRGRSERAARNRRRRCLCGPGRGRRAAAPAAAAATSPGPPDALAASSSGRPVLAFGVDEEKERVVGRRRPRRALCVLRDAHSRCVCAPLLRRPREQGPAVLVVLQGQQDLRSLVSRPQPAHRSARDARRRRARPERCRPAFNNNGGCQLAAISTPSLLHHKVPVNAERLPFWSQLAIVIPYELNS